jgi:hypothetical protein
LYGTGDLVLETDSNFYIGAYTARPLSINSANGATGTVYVAADGSTGFGTTSPSSKVEIKASAATNLGGLLLRALGSTNVISTLYENSSNGGTLDLYDNTNAVKVRVSSNSDSYLNGGNVGINNTSPQSSLDVNGVTRTGGSVIGKSILSVSPGTDTYYKIATLPISNSSTYDHIVIEGVINGSWQAADSFPFKILLGNRGSNNNQFFFGPGTGAQGDKASVVVYTESDTSRTVWLKFDANYFTLMSVNVVSSINVTTYPDFPSGTPTGTLSWSSATNIPLTFYDIGNSRFGIGTIAPASKFDVNGTISLAGYSFAANVSHYNVLYTPANNYGLFLGGSGDPGNYYDNTTHHFRNIGGGTPYAVINSAGIGIRTTPTYDLDILNNSGTGLIRVKGAGNGYTQATILLQSATDNSPEARGLGIYTFNEGNDATWYFGNGYQYGDYFIINRKSGASFDVSAANPGESSNFVSIDNTGKVGIGNVSPTYKLDVTGNARITSWTKGFTGFHDQNMLDVTSWYNYSGSQLGGNWTNNGSGNVVTYGTDPFGRKSITVAGVSDGNGAVGNSGWNYAGVPIDHTKSYRLVVFFKQTVSNSSGNFYLGCSGDGSTLNLAGSADYNPYFFAVNRSSFTLGKWYMAVGYIHAYGDPDTTSYSSIYDVETGVPVISGTDYKSANGATAQWHRCYDYYDGVSGATQTYWNPRFEEINGKEPTIEALLGEYKGATVGDISYFGGNVGIGVTGPSYPLHVAGKIYTTGDVQALGTGYFGGDVIAYYSDQRLKTNIRPIESALDKISRLGGYYYEPNELALQLKAATDPKQKLGLLAQEIQKEFPEAIERAPFDMDDNGGSKSGENYLTVKYERLVPVLLQAIKELHELIKNK